MSRYYRYDFNNKKEKIQFIDCEICNILPKLMIIIFPWSISVVY